MRDRGLERGETHNEWPNGDVSLPLPHNKSCIFHHTLNCLNSSVHVSISSAVNCGKKIICFPQSRSNEMKNEKIPSVLQMSGCVYDYYDQSKKENGQRKTEQRSLSRRCGNVFSPQCRLVLPIRPLVTPVLPSKGSEGWPRGPAFFCCFSVAQRIVRLTSHRTSFRNKEELEVGLSPGSLFNRSQWPAISKDGCSWWKETIKWTLQRVILLSIR